MTVAVNLLWAGLCSVGHAALMVAIINRVDAGRVPRHMLHVFTHLHHLSLLAYPLCLLVALLIQGDVTHGSLWGSLPEVLRWYSYGCLAFSVLLPLRVIQNITRRRPALFIEERSQRIDVARELGRRPVQSAGYHPLLHFPGNESLVFDADEKHLRLPRLPAAWDGLTILHLSDTHFTGTIERDWFEHVCKVGQQGQPDLVVFTGDLLDKPELVEWLPQTLGRLSAPLGCWFILGNHDWYAGNPDAIRRELTRLGWTDASEQVRVIEHRGHPLAIAGIERPWMGQIPDFSAVPSDTFRLLLSHTPDQIGWARGQQIDLMVAGHTHGGQVRFPLLGPVYCPSWHGPHYSCGVFWEAPTALHVSRGLSGEAPLRLNCAPELTRLVLHAPVT